MKQLLGLIVAVACFFSVCASDSDAINVEVTVSQSVPATECYVVFLLESSGFSMMEAKAGFDRKLQEFADQCGKEFPEIKRDVISVNTGTREFGSYRAEENPIAPAIGKVLICTLPPDESTAMKLLDLGIKSGLTPFCASSSDNSTFGAVYYGVKNPEKTLTELYPVAVKKLWNQAEKLAVIMKANRLKMSCISYYDPSDRYYQITYRSVKIALPAKFCGGDRNKVNVSLTLSAGFKIANPSDK